MKRIFLLLLIVVLARAQIPGLGLCPEYPPVARFDMDKFAGIWYEAERNFQIVELGVRCIVTNYTKGANGKYIVFNEVRSRLTGIKRVLEGEIRTPTTKAEIGKLHVKYTKVPFIVPETQYTVLDTDYKNFAVLWSCSGVGPFRAQNAWIVTRQRYPPAPVLQQAYGVLDKYKISKTFFVKTNQEDCADLDEKPAEEIAEPQKTTQAPIEEEVEAEEEEQQAAKSAVIIEEVPQADAPAPVVHTRNSESEASEQIAVKQAPSVAEQQPIVEAAEPIQAVQPESVKTVPEVILKIADQAKELAIEAAKESTNELPKESTEKLAKEPSYELKEPTKELVKESIQEAAKEAAIEPAKEPAKEPIKEAAIEEIKAPAQEPAKEAAIESAKEPAIEPVITPAKEVIAEEPKETAPVVLEEESKKSEVEKKPTEIVEEKIEIVNP